MALDGLMALEYNITYVGLFATSLGSSPSIATIAIIGIEFLINSVTSGMFYDSLVNFFYGEGRDGFMKILLFGCLGVGCGDIV